VVGIIIEWLDNMHGITTKIRFNIILRSTPGSSKWDLCVSILILLIGIKKTIMFFHRDVGFGAENLIVYFPNANLFWLSCYNLHDLPCVLCTTCVYCTCSIARIPGRICMNSIILTPFIKVDIISVCVYTFTLLHGNYAAVRAVIWKISDCLECETTNDMYRDSV